MTSQTLSFDFLLELDAEARKLVLRSTHPITVTRGEVVITQGMKKNDVYFVIDGEFEVKLYSEGGKDVLYRTIGPGDLFGEIAAIDGGPRSATVTAQSKGRLARMNGDEFRVLLEQSPRAAMWLVHKHTAQIRGLTSRLFEHIAYNVSTRIRAELLRLGAAAGVKDNQARIFPMPAHRILAAKLGTTREAVTRELGDLTKENLIARKRSRELTILDFEALTERVQSPSDPNNNDEQN